HRPSFPGDREKPPALAAAGGLRLAAGSAAPCRLPRASRSDSRARAPRPAPATVTGSTAAVQYVSSPTAARSPRRRHLRRGEYAGSMKPNERLAVIDLGSNSFRMVVFLAGGSWRRRT